jgi:hypothetical protein
MAFIGLGSAPVCMIHVCAFAHVSAEEMAIFSRQALSARKRVYDETRMLRKVAVLA